MASWLWTSPGVLCFGEGRGNRFAVPRPLAVVRVGVTACGSLSSCPPLVFGSHQGRRQHCVLLVHWCTSVPLTVSRAWRLVSACSVERWFISRLCGCRSYVVALHISIPLCPKWINSMTTAPRRFKKALASTGSLVMLRQDLGVGLMGTWRNVIVEVSG